MNLDNNNRMTRLYLWSLGIVSKFLDRRYYEDKYNERTNLCHFVRVIFLYMPLILLVQVLMILFSILAVVLLPIYLFGAGWYFGTTIGAGIVVGAIFIIRWNKEAIKEAIAYYHSRPRDVVESKARLVQEGPGLVDIIILWLKAQKQRVCPIINIRGGN